MKRAALLLFALPAFAANHYIRSGASGNGSDWTNACSWFTGSCAPANLIRGDIYYVAGGTYSGNVAFNTAESGTSVITIKKATVADHGTSTGWSDTYGTTQWVVNQDSSDNGVLVFSTGYWTLDGATGGGPGSWKTGFGLYINTTRTTNGVPCIATDDNTGGHYVFRHLECAGNSTNPDTGFNTNDGIATGQVDYVTVSYVYLHHQGRCPFFWRANNSTIEYSYLSNNVSGSVHSEGISAWRAVAGQMNNLTVRYNIWDTIDGTGTIVYDGDNLIVYGNVFYSMGPQAGSIGGENGAVTTWTANTVNHVRVYNNTFVSTQKGVAFPSNTPGIDNIAENNLFYNTQAGFTNVTSHDYNWFYLDSGAPYGEAHEQDGSGNPFVNLSSDWHLTGHTTAGNSSLGSPYNVDMDGRSRSAWDRGAYEYVSGTVAPSVTTTSTTSITATTASSGGNVTSDGGASVTARGVCYAITANPTAPCTSNGSGTGAFTSSLTGLTPGTGYHYRAFATNSTGTGYGSDLTFTTLSIVSGSSVSGVVNYSGATGKN